MGKALNNDGTWAGLNALSNIWLAQLIQKKMKKKKRNPDEFKVKRIGNVLSERPEALFLGAALEITPIKSELWEVCQRSELKPKVCEISKYGAWIGYHLRLKPS